MKSPQGELLRVPDDWQLLAPGDAALTRRVKKAGPTWTVKEKRGRRVISLGIWAPTVTIEQLKGERALEQNDPTYQRKLDASRARRAKAQVQYVEDFALSVYEFLAFAPEHHPLAIQLSAAVTKHATPVGSGTVARTQRIPIEQRAEAAVIAWMRHQTTAYDNLKIPRIKGMRREVRRLLADRSRQILSSYRRGAQRPASCPLLRALTD